MLKNKLIFLLDLDGTLYLENELIDGAKDFIDYLVMKKIDFCYITNNSSKNVDSYIKKLNKLGLYATENSFYTSVEATIRYLKDNNIKSIFLIGTSSLLEKLNKHFIVKTEYDENYMVDALLLGFDQELNYQKLVDGSKYLKKGALFLGTNPDLRCPVTKDFFIPDCGSMAKLLEDATDVKPLFIGKPNKIIIDYLLEEKKIKKEDAVLIGDRLYTDILGAINANVDSILVLSGESTLNSLKDINYKPTYIYNSIKEVLNELKGEKEND